MSACPGPGPEPPSSTSALRLTGPDGEPVPADSDQPPGDIRRPVMLLGQESFKTGIPNVARIYGVLLGGYFRYTQ